MCRSIRTLRPPYVEHVDAAAIEAAALQYVRKVSGFRQPSRANQPAFEVAVSAIADATDTLLASLQLRGSGLQTPRDSREDSG